MHKSSVHATASVHDRNSCKMTCRRRNIADLRPEGKNQSVSSQDQGKEKCNFVLVCLLC